MEQFLEMILTHYGPLVIGWVVAAGLGWMVLRERKKPGHVQYEKALEKVSDSYHEAIVANTRAMERLATIIEERTRRR